jgi:UDP:flavonoid glycosyltransferase YjiC (YdhE family)
VGGPGRPAPARRPGRPPRRQRHHPRRAAGVPQLFLPQGADQLANADAVAAAGAGLQLARDEVSADAIEDRARVLLAGACGDAARRVAAEIARMPSPAEVAARLSEYAGRG